MSQGDVIKKRSSKQHTKPVSGIKNSKHQAQHEAKETLSTNWVVRYSGPVGVL